MIYKKYNFLNNEKKLYPNLINGILYVSVFKGSKMCS